MQGLPIEDPIAASLGRASQTCSDLQRRWANHDLRPKFEVELTVGVDNLPVLRFTIVLAINDDFAEDEWPGEAVSALQSDLRADAVRRNLAPLDWYVTVMSQDIAAAR